MPSQPTSTSKNDNTCGTCKKSDKDCTCEKCKKCNTPVDDCTCDDKCSTCSKSNKDCACGEKCKECDKPTADCICEMVKNKTDEALEESDTSGTALKSVSGSESSWFGWFEEQMGNFKAQQSGSLNLSKRTKGGGGAKKGKKAAKAKGAAQGGAAGKQKQMEEAAGEVLFVSQRSLLPQS